MNRRLLIALLAAAVLFLSALSAGAAKIVLDSEKQYDYARHFMERREYKIAIIELERLIYFFPSDERVPDARYLVGLCYLKEKKFEKARDVLFNVTRLYGDRPIGGRALMLIGESYYEQGLTDEAERYFRQVAAEYTDPALRDAAQYRLGWNKLKEENWQAASETFKRVDRRSPLYPNAMDLSGKSLTGEDLPLKDPTAAGIMAGILPGLGHAYCGRYKDGLVALLLNGLFIWGAVEAFEEDLDVVGGIMAFLELGWYSGNIYSAVNCAHKHNRKVIHDFRKGLSDQFNPDLTRSQTGFIGLTMTFDY